MPAVWVAGVETATKRQAPPSMPPPSSEDIAYTNAPEILAITGTFFAFTTLVVLLRCYVRIAMLKVFGRDDYMMVFAAVLAAVTFACFKMETDNGLGKHFMVLMAEPLTYMRMSRLLYIHSITIMVGISAVKISIAFFLLRISTRKPYTRFLWSIIVFIILMTTACAGSLIFQCLPIEAAWDLMLRPPPFGTGTARCYSMITFRNLGLMNSIFNIVTDVLFATLPVPLIWRLQLNLRTRISLIVVLSLGWFACAAAIVKAVLQWSILSDLEWSVHDSFNVWNYIEFTIGILAASLPTLKPLFNWFLDTARAFTTAGKSRGSGRVTGYNAPNSLGYHDMGDNSSKSIALGSLTSTMPSSANHPYKVRITTQNNGLASKEKWNAEHGKYSDDSILPLRNPQGRQHGILMTKEVRVS